MIQVLWMGENFAIRAISRFRGRGERAFGTLNKDHRMARARYLGCAKVGLQLPLDAIAFNLKKAARMAAAYVKTCSKPRETAIRSGHLAQKKCFGRKIDSKNQYCSAVLCSTPD
jgi:hypothetical protein